MVQFRCQVNVFGMLVNDGDVVHADRHGAVVIPADVVTRLLAAIDLVMWREKVILDRTRALGFTSATLREALRRAEAIH
jgi:regulator of RNase E activity RraA